MSRLFRKIQSKKDTESGVAMIVAVLVILVMVGIVTFMTSFAIRSLEKGTSVQNLNSSLNAADTAIANMMTVANSQRNSDGSVMERHLGVGNAVYGSFQANEVDPETGDGQYSWRWYAEKVNDSSKGTTYEVYATGYKKSVEEKDARTIKMVISSTTVEEISYSSNGSILYVSSNSGSYAFGAFANILVDMGKNAKANVYDSNSTIGYPSATLTKGTIATNENIVMAAGSSANLVFLKEMSSESGISALCSGAGCNNTTMSNFAYQMSLNYSRKMANAACPLASYPDWVASANGGKITDGGTKCYNNIIFDADTSLATSISTGNQTTMYAKGNITVKPGIEVAKQLRTSQGPNSLQIIASGSTKFLMERGTTANPTKFTGLINGMALTCDIGGDSTSTTAHGTAFYGSLACHTVKVQQDSSLWWDKQLEKVLKKGSATASSIWSASSYEEI